MADHHGFFDRRLCMVGASRVKIWMCGYGMPLKIGNWQSVMAIWGCEMEIQIDKFGRIVIPKAMREHLGLKTGSVLYIEEHNHGIILKVAENIPRITVKNGIAVYNGKPTDDIESSIQHERDDRLDKLGD